jgi:hypothetical protein
LEATWGSKPLVNKHKQVNPFRFGSLSTPGATMSSGGKQDPVASTSSTTVDLDKLLSREANAFQRDVEVERILKAFKLK